MTELITIRVTKTVDLKNYRVEINSKDYSVDIVLTAERIILKDYRGVADDTD